MKQPLILATLVAGLTVTAPVSAKSDNVTFLNANPSTLPFSEAVKVGDTLYLSGKIGLKGKKLVPGGVKAEAAQVMTNIQQALARYDYTMSDVVKCTVMLTDINDFKAFNAVYKSFFSPPYPARSAFAVKALALNSTVEVECIAAK